MPNWCDSSLLVSGSEKLVRKLELATKDGEIKNLFSLFYPRPMPISQITEVYRGGKSYYSREVELNGKRVSIEVTEEDIKRLDELYGAHGWYEWSVNNWGTKWDVDAVANFDDLGALLQFETAWGPANLFAARLSEDYPEAKIRLAYAEGGCAFYGCETYVGGLCIDQLDSDEPFWKEVEGDYDDIMDVVGDNVKHLIEECGVPGTGG